MSGGAAANTGGSASTKAKVSARPGGPATHRLDTLDSVRGIAALVVVVHHCVLCLPAFSDRFFLHQSPDGPFTVQWLLMDTPARLVWDGYEAVILFYVLSGLVLALPWVQGRPPDYRAFAVKRIARIYLPYLVAVGASALLCQALGPALPLRGISEWVNEMNWSNPVTPAMLAFHLLLSGHQNHLDGPIHSLVWEMRVSLLFPLIVMPTKRWGWRGTAGVVACLCVLVAAIQWRWAGNDVLRLLPENIRLDTGGKVAREVVWTAFFGLTFVMGILLAFNLSAMRDMWHRVSSVAPRLAPWLGGALAVAGLMVIQAQWSRHEVFQDLLVGVGACMVVCASFAPGGMRRLLTHRLLTGLGGISYSLYLIHVPLLFTLLILLHDVLPAWTVLVAVPPAAVALAWLFERTVTEPCVALGTVLASRAAGPHGQRPAKRPHRDLPRLVPERDVT